MLGAVFTFFVGPTCSLSIAAVSSLLCSCLALPTVDLAFFAGASCSSLMIAVSLALRGRLALLAVILFAGAGGSDSTIGVSLALRERLFCIASAVSFSVDIGRAMDWAGIPAW